VQTTLLAVLLFSPIADPITPDMRAALGRANKPGMERKAKDEAVEDLHREIGKNPKVFVPLAIPPLMQLAPQDTRTRNLLRDALEKGWLEKYHAHLLLVRAGDDPGPHIKVLIDGLDDAKTRKTAVDMIGGLGAEGKDTLPKLKMMLADAKADPSDFSRAYTATDDAPEHVHVYWAIIRIEAALTNAKKP
jgi:hypothetical protein